MEWRGAASSTLPRETGRRTDRCWFVTVSSARAVVVRQGWDRGADAVAGVGGGRLPKLGPLRARRAAATVHRWPQ